MLILAAVMPAVVVTAAGADKPPLIPHIPELIFGFVMLGIVYLVVAKKVVPNIERAYEERRAAIEGGMKQAEEAQAQAQAALQSYEAQLAEARAEANAIRRAFGAAADGMAVSATKSMTGHILGGSGAVEAVLTVLAVHHRTAPCTINLENQDPEIDLDVVTDARDLPSGDFVAVSNSFGFGGHNAVAAFRTV